MKIAIIGGGASGIVTAYLLDKQGHQVTVFEREPMLGGHIRTLNQNVRPNQSDCGLVLENGVLEFPTTFHNFITLMTELEVELEPVNIGSTLFLKNGNCYLSKVAIDRNFTGIKKLLESWRMNLFYFRSASLLIAAKFWETINFRDRSVADTFQQPSLQHTWLKLFAMYSYSIPFSQIDDCPAELVIPTLRDDVFVDWVRIKGGVYSYIQKILDRFTGEILLGIEVAAIRRTETGVSITSVGFANAFAGDKTQEFDKVVFATPPDVVLKLLADPRPDEISRFTAWQGNHVQTLLHNDVAMYAPYKVKEGSEFDFFETDKQHGEWGYNARLNQLCGISSPIQYSLAFNLENSIAPARILHIQQHHTPLYTVPAFRHRSEIIATNGDYHTYHVGAYLGDGLHEGAITSAMRVAALIATETQVQNEEMVLAC
ncbi:FAD-dependent oxidoreductase [Chamaesiphon minutus]|uniref:Putative NAD/FAD-binding protein n=1 Tax=Chamaesiphon minutus (strain ATCC 27169 / PCC 6605) TaxID=1173020 RepID=K9UCF4_CHAP6|nr:FAD-dependent oxidoreductase [Chamaesiphon minutus]AFY92520.1 putative NAD/FAD-binding protein [Chamaesiphon minutus PCC 6605]